MVIDHKWLFVLVVFFQGVWFVFQQQEPSPLPIEAYWAFVEETQDLVVSLEETPPETAQAQLEVVADEWAVITAVSTTDNQVVRVNHAVLEAQLRADPPDLAALAARLEALLAARDAWPEAVYDAGALNSLNEILSRDEFQWPEEEPGQSSDFVARILEFLVRLFPDSTIGGGFLGDLLLAMGAIVLAVALFFALRGLFMDFVVESELGEGDGLEDDLLTAETALKKAQTLSTGGDYRMAVRYLYLSTLLILEERGLFRYDRSKTNREYLRSVQERPELAATLRDVVDVFDRVWYGFQPLSRADYSQYQTRVEALRQQQ